MTPVWHERARAMKAADPARTHESIARELGFTRPAVTRALNPENTRDAYRRDNAARAAAKRAWENEHDRGVCACGALMSVGAARRGIKQCRACRDAAVAAHTAARRLVIQKMWGWGWTSPDIAGRLGSTTGSIGVEVRRMRDDGWDMPYRRAHIAPKAPVAPPGELGDPQRW